MDFFDCFETIVTENIQDTTDLIFMRKFSMKVSYKT